MITPLLLFAACAATIIFCGIRLSRYGDMIAEKSGMGKAWFGLIMMASVTSLPELVTGISSVAIIGVPDIAIGDIVGSCMFNILILSILDFFYKGGPVSGKVQSSQVLGAGFGVVILTFVVASFAFAPQIPVVGWVGASSLVFIFIYLVSMRTIYAYEKRNNNGNNTTEGPAHSGDEISLRKAIGYYLLNALFVIIAAIFLPEAGQQIAEATGLGQTFVGTLLIAASTSLPELVVSISALRIGAIDLAIGNIFGSNLFNILILAIDDIFYTQGSLLQVASGSHLVSLLGALIMTGIAIIGFVFQQRKKRWKLAADTFAIGVVYIIVVAILYRMR